MENIPSSLPQLIVLFVNPTKADQNIPNDSSLNASTNNLGIRVLNQMYKGNGNLIWKNLNCSLKKSGYKLTCCAIEDKLPANMKTAIIIDFEESLIRRISSEINKILLIYEPPLMDAEAHHPCYQRHFQAIMSFTSPKILQEQLLPYINYSYPVKRPRIKRDSCIPFSERALCCFVATAKSSFCDGEAVSTRTKVVDYFNAFHSSDFKVFGRGWEDYPNINQGLADNKDTILQKHKFVFCPENMRLEGYDTEKPWDAFANHCVPIRQKNPGSHIPEETYINLDRFSNLDEFYDYMKHMTEEEWNAYHSRIESFYQSEEAKNFTPEIFAHQLSLVIKKLT